MVVLRAGLCPGLTEDMIQLLRDNGIRTVVDFVSSDLEDVAQKCSLSYKALVAVRRVLLAQFSAFPANGADLYEELKSSTAILPTGSPSLDQLLDSGLYTGEVMELMGAPGTGKTQVCLGIAASVSLGLKQHVLFLDSTGGFTASRLYQMLQAQTEDEEEQLEALQRVQVQRVFNIYEVLRALQELRDHLSQQVLSSMGPLKVVVLDSVSAVIYPLLSGRQSEGLALMMQLSRELKTLAREFSLAVVVTNQVTRDSSTGPLKPALGRSWSFVPSTRVLLESREGSWERSSPQRAASLAKSPRQPEGTQPGRIPVPRGVPHLGTGQTRCQARLEGARVSMTEVEPVLDFASSGRTGRRNALPDILGSPAGVSPADLPLKLAEMSLSAGSAQDMQSPSAEAPPPQPPSPELKDTS